MLATVIKGVDDDIEFKGFKGRYFYFLAGTVVGLLVLTFLLYSIGLSSFILFFMMILIASGAYMYIKHLMDILGRYGHIKQKHAPPKYIIINNSFRKMVK